MAPETLQIFSPKCRPYGRTYGEWSVCWWKWLLGIERNKNPAIDMTGEYGKVNQGKKILFLCQTFESTQYVPRRKLMVDRGTVIFMPIINYLATIPDDGLNEEEMISTAKRKMDSITIVRLSINLVDIKIKAEEFRFRSNVFRVSIPSCNLLGIDCGIVTCVSDGYWIMLEPVDRPLVISSIASCSSGKTRISVDYSIELPDQDGLHYVGNNIPKTIEAAREVNLK